MELFGQRLGAAPLIIAELSANHLGDLKRAFALMEAARDAGADALKIQTYTADCLTIDCGQPDFWIDSGLWAGQSLYQLYEKAQTPFEWQKPLFEHAARLGIPLFSSPFSSAGIELLERLGCPAYKIASFEIVDLPLIRCAAQTGKPLILSTGMASTAEIDEAVAAARESGCTELVLLHCVSSYPAQPRQFNLMNLRTMAERYSCPTGLSDHSLDATTGIAASALGAVLIEKHLKAAGDQSGPDAGFSIEPEAFQLFAEACRTAAASVVRGTAAGQVVESENRRFRRSLYWVQSVKAGERITEAQLRVIRPGFGLAPKELDQILGKTLRVDVDRGERVAWDQIAQGPGGTASKGTEGEAQ